MFHVSILLVGEEGMIDIELSTLDEILKLRRRYDVMLHAYKDEVFFNVDNVKYYCKLKDEERSLWDKYKVFVGKPIVTSPLRICTANISTPFYTHSIPTVANVKQVFKKLRLTIFGEVRLDSEVPVVKVIVYENGKVVGSQETPSFFSEVLRYADNLHLHPVGYTMVVMFDFLVNFVLDPFVDNSWIDIECINNSGVSYCLCLLGKGVMTF